MAKSILYDLERIFSGSISAVMPRQLVRQSLKYCQSTEILSVKGENFDLKNKKLYVVGAGKAAQNMALEVEVILGQKITSGIISIPKGSFLNRSMIKNMAYLEGGENNLPDKNAVVTANKIKKLVTSLKENDFLLALISGGGSALLSLPKPPITLNEKINLVKTLADSGADIKELNTVRKRISQLKGGQLAINAFPAQVVSLILSDVVGNPLHLIASGPTAEDEDDPLAAMKIIKKYNLQEDVPKSIETILNDIPDYHDKFPRDNVRNFIIGSNKLSTEAAYNFSRNLNYEPVILTNSITGNVKDVAKKYITLIIVFCDFLQKNISIDDVKNGIEEIALSQIYNNADMTDISKLSSTTDNLCLILGGETTVEVKGSGKGGRNQQLALEFSNLLHTIKNDVNNFDVYILCGGTDGIDGPTDKAGAMGYLDLKTDAQIEGLDVDKYIENNDSYNFYKQFKKGHLHVGTAGFTYTNVMDIHYIIIKRKKKCQAEEAKCDSSTGAQE